jgi:hypothetical protein
MSELVGVSPAEGPAPQLTASPAPAVRRGGRQLTDILAYVPRPNPTAASATFASKDTG